jgi:hypothetical protein
MVMIGTLEVAKLVTCAWLAGTGASRRYWCVDRSP